MSSCNRLEFVPARHVALAWWLWLAMVGLVLLLAVDLPPPARLAIAIPLAGSVATVRRFMLLQGPLAVRAVEWGGSAGFHVWLGRGTKSPAVPVACRRYGGQLWLLQFATAEGRVGLWVQTGLQPPRALRRLGRSLDRWPGCAVGPPAGQ